MMANTIIFSFLGFLTFLYTVNLFLRGARTQTVTSVLKLLIFALVITSFFLLGWIWGIVALISPFVLTRLFRPIARIVAYKFLGFRTGIHRETLSVQAMNQQMAAGESGFRNVLETISRDAESRRARLSTVASKSEISSVLRSHNLSFDQYETLFNSLRASALHDLAWDIISTPSDLESLIQLKAQGATEHQIWSRFRAFR